MHTVVTMTLLYRMCSGYDSMQLQYMIYSGHGHDDLYRKCSSYDDSYIGCVVVTIVTLNRICSGIGNDDIYRKCNSYDNSPI